MQKTVLCYGDSNTWGYVPGSGKQRYGREVRWPGKLQLLLGEEYYIVEEGLNSRTIVWEDPVTGHRSGLEYLIPCLQSHRPVDLIIIMLGTNDTQERFQLNGYNIARSMRRLLDAVLNSRAGNDEKAPEILLAAPPHIRDNLPETDLGENMGRGCEWRSREIAAYYKELCLEYGIHFIDVQTICQASPVDAVHLDQQGHQELAKSFAEKVQEIIG